MVFWVRIFCPIEWCSSRREQQSTTCFTCLHRKTRYVSSININSSLSVTNVEVRCQERLFTLIVPVSELVDSFSPQCTTASCSLIFLSMLALLPGTTCCSPSGLLLCFLLLSVFLLFSFHSSSFPPSPVAQTMGPWLQPAAGPIKPTESFHSEAQGLQGKSYNLAW